ncbi:MAG: hypothetical protein GAK35_03525 [Herbaspirillum frisingense]|uniref:DUF218 domain-containing protein n=1 Tax=Herbaspirillum frisingense TaxID=92645 RepID=A0A7V8FU14_9BURK|nr:MAG: hypothetical protein GAK35_03525 [Herbaspirillum frisingense]
MPLSVLISAIASTLLLPPVSPVLLCTAGFLLRRRARRTGRLLMALGIALLLVLSTHVGALLLVRPLESQYRPLSGAGDAQAIVILGSGRIDNAPEYGGIDDANMIGMKRLQYGAYLHRQTGLPILVTGGAPDGSPESEAALMARTLSRDFGVETRWQEGRSNNTAENATMSAAMLKAAGITRILLVTDSIHMPRSMRAFAQTGLDVRAAPTMFATSARPRVVDYFPNASNLRLASYAMHECVGQLWYMIRH